MPSKVATATPATPTPVDGHESPPAEPTTTAEPVAASAPPAGRGRRRESLVLMMSQEQASELASAALSTDRTILELEALLASLKTDAQPSPRSIPTYDSPRPPRVPREGPARMLSSQRSIGAHPPTAVGDGVDADADLMGAALGDSDSDEGEARESPLAADAAAASTKALDPRLRRKSRYMDVHTTAGPSHGRRGTFKGDAECGAVLKVRREWLCPCSLSLSLPELRTAKHALRSAHTGSASYLRLRLPPLVNTLVHCTPGRRGLSWPNGAAQCNILPSGLLLSPNGLRFWPVR